MGNKAKGLKVKAGKKAKAGKGGATLSKPQKGAPKKRKAPGLKSDADVAAPLGPDEDELIVSDDDIEFVESYGQKLSFLTGDDFNQDTLKVSKKQRSKKEAEKAAGAEESPPTEKKAKWKKDAAEDADLQTYEAVPRGPASEPAAKRQVLPIKIGTGEVVFEKSSRGAAPLALPQVPGVHVEAEEVEEDEEEEDEQEEQQLDGEEEEGEGEQEADDDDEDREDSSGQAENLVAQERLGIREELMSFQDQAAYREKMKAEIAASATKMTSDPEKNLGELKTLLGLATDQDAQVACWAMLSLLMVFRDVLPGYRIRLPTAAELAVKVSKEVGRVRDFESGLLRAYQAFLKLLLQAAKKHSSSTMVPQVAVKCMAGLLETHYYFNYAGDILTALVPRMADRNPRIRLPATAALAAVVQHDQEGQIAMEAVQLVADLVKKRKCLTPPDLVWALLEVRISEVSREELERLKEAAGGGKIKRGKKKKGKTEEERQLQKDFRETSGEVDMRTKVRLQSRMLDALFELFFRALKTVQSTIGAAEESAAPLSLQAAMKRWPLLEPTLAGIEKLAHLISLDFFGDLLQCLASIAKHPRLPGKMRARALLAVSGVLSGQGAALTVDHHSFHCSLYRAMLDMPIQPLLEQFDEAEGVSLAEQLAGDSAGMMLLKAVARGVVDPKSTDITRLSSFVKRAAYSAASVESGECLGYLSAVGRLLRRHFKLRGMLEGGMARSQFSKPVPVEEEEPSTRGCLDTPLWELSLLASHYHPEVASVATCLARMGESNEAQLPAAIAGARGPADVAAAFSSRRGAFCPPPQPPRKQGKAARGRAARAAAALPVLAGELGIREVDMALDLSTGDSTDSEGAAVAAMTAHFRTTRAYVRNFALRSESKRLARQLQLAANQTAKKRRTNPN